MANNNTPVSKTCSFAYAGTFGHECGAPAVTVAVKASKLTHSGMFFTGRCAECAKIKGGENAGIIRMEPVAEQTNDWNGRYN